MSTTSSEEKIPILGATVEEAKNNADTNGTEKLSSEKENSIIVQKTKEKEDIQIALKNNTQDYPAKDAEVQEEKGSNNIEKGVLKEKDDTNNGAKTVQPLAVEDVFQEETVKPVESLKDISDHLNSAAKSVMQKVAEKVEEKIEKSVEKEERKGVQELPSQKVTRVENTFKEEKVKPVESSFEEKVEVTKEEEKPVESSLDEKVEIIKEEDEVKLFESSSEEKVEVTKEEEKVKPVESSFEEKVEFTKEEEKVKPVESSLDEKVEVIKEEDEIKPVEFSSDEKVEATQEEEKQDELPPDTKDDKEIESKTKQDDVDGNETTETMIEPICIEKTVKPLGSPEMEPKPDSLSIESSNENNLSVPISGAKNKPDEEEKEETQPLLITEESGTNSQISEGVTPEEKESFADIAQKIPFADENSDDILEEEGKAPIVYDDETKGPVENTMIQNEETKEAEEEEKEESQPKNIDSESATDIAQEAEAEAEPCTEEIQEPVEAIIDDVEIESVSDNIETGSEQSTTSDTNDSNEKKKSSVNILMVGAILVALIALLIAILSVDMTSISRAIGITKPEPKPIVKPFWKFF